MPSCSEMRDKRYNCLDPYLHQVTTIHIAFGEDDRKKSNKDLAQVIFETLVPQMNYDPLFKGLFKRFQFSGSSYENLKIGKPDEFDLNVELELPATKMNVEQSSACPGFGKVRVEGFNPNKVKRCFPNASDGEKVKRWLDANNYVRRDRVIQWMQSVVDRSLLNVQFDNLKVTRSTSGPAITLNVKQKSGKETFSVDLVPVFVFGKNNWPMSPVRQPLFSGSPDKEEWYMVPKPPRGSSDTCLWRMSFYRHEGLFMNNLEQMKHIIKVIKLLRNEQGWANLSSYYIKTVFLWEHEKQGANFWRRGVGFVFMHMLRELLSRLREFEIPFFWYRESNLVSHLSPTELNNMANRLEYIIKSIDRRLPEDPQHMFTYFRCSISIPPSVEVAKDEQQGDWFQIITAGVGALTLGSSIFGDLQLQRQKREQEEREKQQQLQQQQQSSLGWGSLLAGAVGVGLFAAGAAYIGNQMRRDK